MALFTFVLCRCSFCCGGALQLLKGPVIPVEHTLTKDKRAMTTPERLFRRMSKTVEGSVV